MGAKLLVGDIIDIHGPRPGKCQCYETKPHPRIPEQGIVTRVCDLPEKHDGPCRMIEGNVIGKRYIFHCPGCGYGHHYTVYDKPNGKCSWTFNGNLESPTFTPSLLHHPTADGAIKRCHIFLTNGVVDFLGDCQHEYAGKKYPLPDVETT